ncbi:PAS domain-containing sensor histidine kinase [Flammeovirgaceae bacterium SG7u.111]|nr:PAS domain-containing sensor histidine kinase [Flammeovirgaceae bacterium SG7u.132]WPO37276.1 PAS domain-containing sensor histidine kinase [Flammeovirgaceae bacterium SG7u.111]
METKLTYEKLQAEVIRLKQEDDFFKSIFDSLLVGLVVHAADTSILLSNPKAHEILGLTKEQMQGKTAIDPIWKFVDMDKKNIVVEDYPVSKVIASKKVLKDCILGIVKPNVENITWVDVKALPKFDTEGNVDKVIVNFIDITEQIETENKVKKLNIAVDQSANATLITDTDGNIEYVNQKFTDLTGYTAEEILGKNPNLLNAGTQPIEYREAMWAKVSSGKTWEGEFHNKKKNGEYYWEYATITPIKDKKGNIINYLEVKEDYTARKQAEEALRASEEKFRKLFDEVPALLDAFDENGKCIYWNKECQKVFGWTIDEVNAVDNSLALFYPDPNVQKEVLDSVTNQPELVFKEWYPLTKGGKELTVMWANVSLDDGTVINIGHDITDLKQTEKELKESNDTKDKFFSIIAHDLKNPFNAILGFTKILLANHRELDEESRETIIRSVNDSANNAFKLLENLLTWSRAQSGKIKYVPEQLQLKELLLETISALQEVANEKNIQLSDLISEDEVVFADSNMLATVFRNLISNAIKFTQTGGTIIIKSNKQHDEDFIEISVADSGVGISKDNINNLFCIDKNTSTQGTENEKGTGLGLILSKEFIEKHGGMIWVESEVDKGSTFSFTVPCKSETEKF